MTIVVDTEGPHLYVGRCDDIDENEVVLLDADVHEEGPGGPSKGEYLRAAARFGIWKRMERVAVPARIIKSIKRLGEISSS